MNLVLCLIFVFIIIQIFFLMLYFSKLRFRFEKCEIIYNEKMTNKFNIKEIDLYVDLIIIKKIKILTVKVTTEYCQILNFKFNVDGIKRIKNEKENSIIFILKNLNKIKPSIRKMELILSIGTNEMILDIALIPIISTYVSVLVSKYFLNSSKENFYMKITPNFLNVNNFVFKVNTIIDFSTINFLFFLLKQRNKVIEK